MLDLHKIAPFFSDWQETLIWSCLQGCMGHAIADHNEKPTAAQIVVGAFCFYAIKKEPDVFNSKKLAEYANLLDEEYTLKLIDKEIYDYMIHEDWSRDLCS